MSSSSHLFFNSIYDIFSHNLLISQHEKISDLPYKKTFLTGYQNKGLKHKKIANKMFSIAHGNLLSWCNVKL